MDSTTFDTLVAIAVIVAAARVVGSGAVRLGQPRVVGEIVAGLLLGPTLLGSWSDTMVPSDARPMLSAVGDVGLTLFMLVVAVNIDWGRLAGRGRAVAIVSGFSLSIPAAGGAVAAIWWWNDDHVPGFGTDAAPSAASFAVLVATAASVTALPVAAKILAERGQLGDDVGRISISVAAVSTAAMFIGLGIGLDLVDGFDAGVLAGRLVGVVLLGVGAVIAIRVIAVAVRWWSGRSESEWIPERAGVVAVAVAAALGTGALTDRMGLHAMIGGFLFGVVLERGVSLGSLDVDVVRSPVVGSIGPIVDVVLLPVFLAVAGLRTDLRETDGSVLLTAGVLLAIAVIGRWSGAYAG
ncbi:MAG: cation:proton antiporter, partial [Actinomycetota bacterium]